MTPPDSPAQGREVTQISLTEIQDAHLAMLSAIRDEVQRLFETHTDATSLVTETLKRLFWYMSQRSQAASFLVSWEYTWDAEIVLRSFYEAAAKIVFICRAKASEKKSLVEEFWDGLGAAGDRRRARKAEFAQAVFKNDPGAARIFEYLRSPRASRETSASSNRATRKAIEKKWSFSEIIETLEGELPGAKSLLHIYGMASHLIHSDTGALELMMDRQLREPEELLLLRMSHACRILSDQVALWYLCAASLRDHFGSNFSDGKALAAQMEACTEMTKPVHRLFQKTQDEFYTQQAQAS